MCRRIGKIFVVPVASVFSLQSLLVALSVICTTTWKTHNGGAKIARIDILGECQKHDLSNQVAGKTPPAKANVSCLEARKHLWYSTNAIGTTNNHHVVRNLITQRAAMLLVNALVVEPVGPLLVLAAILAVLGWMLRRILIYSWRSRGCRRIRLIVKHSNNATILFRVAHLDLCLAVKNQFLKKLNITSKITKPLNYICRFGSIVGCEEGKPHLPLRSRVLLYNLINYLKYGAALLIESERKERRAI